MTQTLEALAEITPRRRMSVKVYLVFQFINVANPANPGGPNTRVIAAKLTRAAALEVVGKTPGTFLSKIVADK